MLAATRFCHAHSARHRGLDPPVHRDENDKVAHLSAESRESRRDSSETRQSRGADGQRHAEYLLDTTVAQARTGFKAVSTGWGNNKTTHPAPSYWLQGSIHGVGQQQDNTNLPRHTGFKAVSTGRQGDAGEQDNTTHIPLSLDGRGIKGEGDPVLDIRTNPH